MNFNQLFIFYKGEAIDYWSPWIPKTTLDLLLFVLVLLAGISLFQGKTETWIEKRVLELYLLLLIGQILGGIILLFSNSRFLELSLTLFTSFAYHATNYFWLVIIYIVLLVIRKYSNNKKKLLQKVL